MKKLEKSLDYLSAYEALGVPHAAKWDPSYWVREEYYAKYGYCPEALEDENNEVRKGAYKALGYTEEAKRDDSRGIRMAAYEALGWTEEAYTDEDPDIRLRAYETLGWKESAFDDERDETRMEAYKILGWTKKALTDERSNIRLEAYKALGWTKKAAKDEDWEIRHEYYRATGWTEEAKQDFDSDIVRGAFEALGYKPEDRSNYFTEFSLEAMRRFGFLEENKDLSLLERHGFYRHPKHRSKNGKDKYDEPLRIFVETWKALGLTEELLKLEGYGEFGEALYPEVLRVLAYRKFNFEKGEPLRDPSVEIRKEARAYWSSKKIAADITIEKGNAPLFLANKGRYKEALRAEGLLKGWTL